ncbi:MAG TPA: HD domain-containing phosphohydrolase [Thermaerobacter sp.]
MLRVAVEAVPPGAVLARTLYAPNGQPVLRAGHPLTHSLLHRLTSFGIRFVWLEEPAVGQVHAVEPLTPPTALRVERTLHRVAEAAAGTPILPDALRTELVQLAGQVVEELEAVAAGPRAPLPYPTGSAAGDGRAAWVAGAMNRGVLAGLLALAGPYHVHARDFVLAAWLQDTGLLRPAPPAPQDGGVAEDHRGEQDGTAKRPPRGPEHGGMAQDGRAEQGGRVETHGHGRTAADLPDTVDRTAFAPTAPRCHPLAALDPPRAAHRPALAHVHRTLQWLTGVELGGLVRALVAQHHEQRDGRGYPDGLRGDAIHPAARRMAATTAYTLAIEGCIHRPGWLPHEAYEWLLAEGPRLWGDDVIRELAGLLHPYPPGSLVQIDGGPWGIVVDCAGARRLRPKVRLLPVRPGGGAGPEEAARGREPATEGSRDALGSAGEVPQGAPAGTGGAPPAGGLIDLLEERTRQITAWAVAWPASPAPPASPAGSPGPAGAGR